LFRVQRTWLQQYPAGVPTDIDPGEYASLSPGRTQGVSADCYEE
jgi:hypothetical protein